MPKALHPELKITVQNDGTVIAENLENGQEGSDGKIDSDELLLETLKTFRDWLNQGKLNITLERELQLLGKLLRRLLFGRGGTKVQRVVDEALSEGMSSNKRICVQLEFQEKQGALQSLPWEFLYDEENKCFFATNNNVVLTRYIASPKGRQSFCSEALPLRMLIIVSRVPVQKAILAKDAVNAIQQFARGNPNQIILDEPIEGADFLQLRDRLTALRKDNKQPHLIHFIGHGRYNKSKRQGEVALPNTAGEGCNWVDQNQFSRLFKESNCIPRLLFLQLCEGAFVEEAEMIASFEGLVPELVSADVQAVVAMQFPIKNIHATQICILFYEELCKGASVGEALQTARSKMLFWRQDSPSADIGPSPIAAGTPVLYMYGYDGAIITVPNVASHTMGVGTLGTAYPTAPGRTVSRPDGSPSTPIERPTLGPLATPSPSGKGWDALDVILRAGADKIRSMADSGDISEEEKMATNRAFFLIVRPAMRDKDMYQTQGELADRIEHEADTPLRKVLEEMLAVAGKQS
jgi:hypothetical protein